MESAHPSPRQTLFRGQGPILLISLGHGATHWLLGTFYIILPFFTRELGISYTQAGLLVATLQVSSFLTNAAGGAVVDLSGRRMVFLVACLLMGGSAMVGVGFNNLFPAMVVLVVLLGISVSLWHAPAIALISGSFPDRRGYALSIHSTGASLGDMVAPGIAGILLTVMSWHDAAVLSSAPAFLLALALPMLLRGAVMEPKATGGGTRMGARQYLLALRQLFRRMGMVGMCLMVALRGMAQAGLTMFLPLYLADVMRVSPGMVGGTVLAMHLGAVVMSPIAGALSDRMGRRPVVRAGLFATTIIIFALTLLDNTVLFVGGVSLLGFSLYAIRAVMQSWMIDIFPQHLSGTATSVFFALQAGFSAMIPLLGGLVADSFGLFYVFYLLAGIMLLSNVMIFLIPKGIAREEEPA